MSEFWRKKEHSKDFRRIQAFWEKRLAEDDLAAIDSSHKGTALLDLSSRQKFKTGIKDSVIEYFDWARLQTEKEKFKSLKHKILWRLHSEGLTGHEIGKILHLHRRRVNTLIETIRGYLKARKSKNPPLFHGPREEILWELHSVEKLSERKIAEILGISQARVHQLLSRLRKKR